MNRKIALAMTVSFVIVIGTVWLFIQTRQYKISFSNIKNHDTKGSVLRAMGKPWKTVACGVQAGGWSPNCKENYIYMHPSFLFQEEYWIVDFDSNQRVLWKRHIEHLNKSNN